MTETTMAASTTDLIVSPHPLTQEGRTITRAAELQPGETLAAFVGRAGVDLALPGWAITIGGAVVPELLWCRTRPAHGQVIEVRRTAEKSVLRIVALVALAYFTMGAGSGALLGAFGATAGTFTAFAIQTAALALGSMVINRVLGPSVLSGSAYNAASTGSTYSLQGGRNRPRQFEPLGLLFGQVRVVPDFAAQPYSAFESDEQYQYLRLHAGLNTGAIAELKVGDTAITSYEGVTVQQSGFPGGPSVLSNWDSVDSVAGGLLDAVTAPGAYVLRTTSVGTVRIAVDVVAQLYQLGDQGENQAANVSVEMEYRLLPAGGWAPFVGASAYVLLSNSSTKPLRRTYSKDVASGQYEVRLRKATVNVTTTRAANTVEWAQLKSTQNDTTDYSGQPQVGIRVKASGQLQGVLDEVNWLATSEASPLWNGSAWTTVATSNPGAHFLRFVRGATLPSGRLAFGMGKPDAQIDLEGIKAWMLHCTAKGYRFDQWFDARASCGEVLEAIAAAGLGSISYHTGKLGLVWADEDQPIEAVLSPVRMKPGTFRVEYATRELADELEVTWPERSNNWLPASLRLLAPGVTVPRETARLAPVGVTDQAGALVQARFSMAQNIYQRKAVSWEMDLEHIAFNRFSMVALSHDVTQWGYSGRLHSAVMNLIVHSEDFSTAYWTKGATGTGTAPVVTANDGLAPDGTMTADKVVLNKGAGTTAGDFSFIHPNAMTTVTGEPYNNFVWLRTTDGSTVTVRLDFSGLEVTPSSSLVVTPTWQRFDVSMASIGGTNWRPVINLRGAVGTSNFASLHVWGCQFAKGLAAGPYARSAGVEAVAITLDMEVPFNSGAAARYVALHIPGESGYRVFGVATFSGTTHTLTLSGAWPGGVALPGDSMGNPAHDTVWLYDFSAQPGQRMRVVNIEPTANMAGAKITAVPEPDAFWDYVNGGAYVAPPPATLRSVAEAYGLRVTQELLMLTTEYATELSIMFEATGPYDHAQVWGAADGNALQLLGETRTTRFAGWRVQQGQVLAIQVRPFDMLGRPGTVVATSYTVVLVPYAPLVTTGLVATVQPFGVQLQCAKNAELIVVGYEWRVGAVFATAEVLDEMAGTSFAWRMQAAGSYTVWVAAVDYFGTLGPASSVVVTLTAPAIGTVAATVAGPDLQLDFTGVAGSFAISGYRISHGSTFAGSTAVGTFAQTRHTRRVDWGGARRWWVAAVDVAENVGAGMSVDLTINPPGVVTGTRSEVVDNNALLYWAPPTSGGLPVDRYEVRKGSAWLGGEVVGSNGNSTFAAIFEQQAGVYSYWVAAVDTAGTAGTAVAIVATINQPPDYVLRDDYNDDFVTASPTLSGMYVEDGKVYGPALGETIQVHFESRGWATPNAQITAGYPLVFQPSGTSGYYERTLDYFDGAAELPENLLPATVITVTTSTTVLSGSAPMTAQISYKATAAGSWIDAPTGALQAMAAGFRYLRVRLSFTAAGGDDLIELAALNIKISGKLATDSGNGAAVSTDSGGTAVAFNVDFIDVRSIVVTPSGTTARYGIYDFVDVPHPTSFKVLLFDSAGARVSGGFSWTARGFS